MNHGLGVWSTTGPFLFEVVSLDHSVQIPAGGSGEEVQIAFRTWTEPKLRAFNVPGGLSVRTAADELGHALAARQTQNRGFSHSRGGETTVALGLPADCGRRIARLSMVDHCFIQRTSSVIQLQWGDNITNRVIEGMNVSMSTKLEAPDNLPGDFDGCTGRAQRVGLGRPAPGDFRFVSSIVGYCGRPHAVLRYAR